MTFIVFFWVSIIKWRQEGICKSEGHWCLCVLLVLCFIFCLQEKPLLLYELKALLLEAVIFSLVPNVMFYPVKVMSPCIGLYNFIFTSARYRVKDKSDRATVEQVSPLCITFLFWPGQIVWNFGINDKMDAVGTEFCLGILFPLLSWKRPVVSLFLSCMKVAFASINILELIFCD